VVGDEPDTDNEGDDSEYKENPVNESDEDLSDSAIRHDVVDHGGLLQESDCGDFKSGNSFTPDIILAVRRGEQEEK
jgi:hypothetical protein